MSGQFKAVILGASGYTGVELVRLLHGHSAISIVGLTADRFAGHEISSLFPHLAPLDLPSMQRIEEVDFQAVDAVFCCLPHGLTQEVIAGLLSDYPAIKIVDLSADFRLSDAAVYEETYGGPHKALELQTEAVYGLTEWARTHVATARLVANPGCYTSTCQFGLIPLLKDGVIRSEDIIVDAASGISGAGRSLKEHLLLSEHNENFMAYGVATHRHAPEIDQVLSEAAGEEVVVSFTPHLLPVTRGILATSYVKMKGDARIEDLRSSITRAYENEPFVKVLGEGVSPDLKSVKGTNQCHISIFADRVSGRAIVISALDNLMKGASGQALQNMNLMLGLPEIMGLDLIAQVP